MLTNKNYIAIADWMLEYKLNVRELLIFSIIYGFTQDNKEFYGSLDYIAEWLGVNHNNNITRYLEPLVKKNLLIKKVVYEKRTKRCIYKSAINNGPIINNLDVDYIIIQPWMITSDGLNLNGKDLLLYGLVYSYSRKGSGNYCNYNKEYFAKWLSCRPDHIKRQIDKVLNKGLIKEHDGKYVAIVPEDIKEKYLPQSDSQSSQIDIQETQSDSDITQIDSQYSPKVIDNKSKTNNLSNNPVINNNDVVSDKELSDFIYIHICTSEYWKISLADKQACENANKTINKINEIATSLKKEDKGLFIKLDSNSVIDIYLKSLNAVEDIYDSFKNPNGYIRSVINSKLLEVKELNNNSLKS